MAALSVALVLVNVWRRAVIGGGPAARYCGNMSSLSARRGAREMAAASLVSMMS